ncbi:hydroxylamine oxidoreductase (plasmid) [Desulfobaculum bizertense]|uniref:multiheme c-type cytochrome n=1 Tax=Desulfobaculum bizertense TaxID=376490 RepID=UPI001F483F7A|nr:multiheme c-type cytochrome [Desulfobaculum bizertense]UIJ39562.1 hydroxylamine oxidoreductase [Desulfobaculum bizertense]
MKRQGIVFLSLILGLCMLSAPAFAETEPAKQSDKTLKREFRLERSMSKQAEACIMCHRTEHPGMFSDWAQSRHAHAGITCIDCHQADPTDKDVSTEHAKQYDRSDNEWGKAEYRVPVASVVTPKDCSRCHPDEVKQYSRSKHANTIEIMWKLDPWLNKGMNTDNERKTGCYYCHGTVIKMKDGKIDPTTWPNVGVGRVNLDGSLGSCTSCHTRHRFSVMEARKPEACGQCHLGPDHPQIEIFTESKHGDIYDTFGDQYNWNSSPGTWTAGVDYRAPTCSACHMSGSGKVMTSHDVTERISWETQAPLTVRPENFKPFPAKTSWKIERDKMKAVCRQCHGDTWINDFYFDYDKTVEEYNEGYYKPAKAMLDKLYEKGLLDKTTYFDEHLEVQFYELWHHEGRRARMGAMMMAPDYAWWHGAYECKHRFNAFMEEANHLLETGEKAYIYPTFPNTGGDTTKPEEIFGKMIDKK